MLDKMVTTKTEACNESRTRSGHGYCTQVDTHKGAHALGTTAQMDTSTNTNGTTQDFEDCRNLESHRVMCSYHACMFIRMVRAARIAAIL